MFDDLYKLRVIIERSSKWKSTQLSGNLTFFSSGSVVGLWRNRTPLCEALLSLLENFSLRKVISFHQLLHIGPNMSEYDKQYRDETCR